jgi:DNA-binding transcriptional LysR family regulator
MDPRRVLTFRAVAHERSFSRAARVLSLTQPAVSQQVAGLEAEIGTRLLDRQPGGLRLTPAGEVLLAHADAVAERLELAGIQLAELAQAARTRLRIGAFPTALAGLVPAAVARVRAAAPGAEVLVAEGTTDDLAERVRRGGLHLAVSFQDAARPRRTHEGLVRRDLMREDFLVALAPEHPLAARPSVRIADLADENWTAPSTDGMVVRACREAGFEPRLVSLTRDQLAIRALVRRGLAVTLAPGLLAEAFVGVALRTIAGTAAPHRDVYVLQPEGGRHPLAAAAVAALEETAAELASPGA